MFLEISQNSQESTWNRCFPVNFAKFLRTPFLQNTSGSLLLNYLYITTNFDTLKGSRDCRIVHQKFEKTFRYKNLLDVQERYSGLVLVIIWSKSIWFGSKHKTKKSKPLNIQYNDIKIKQYSKATYSGCIFDETLSGESMTIHVINKINYRLRFLYHQNRFLNFPLRRSLCNAMIQPFFDYACNAWYPNINKKLKMRLQAAQNKCIKFCLKLNERSSIKSKDSKK